MSPYKDKATELESERRRRADPVRQEWQRAYAQQWRIDNKEKLKKKARGYYEANKDELNAKQRIITLKDLYGITIKEYLDLLASQGGVCAICGAEDPGTKKGGWCVDHDHSCCPGKKTCGNCIRGLLCRDCNSGLG